MKKEKEEIVNKEINKEVEEEEEEENDNENNFYNKYDEYYSDQPLLLKKSNPKAKYNQIDLNNFYPKLKHFKEKSKIKNKENDNDYNSNQKQEDFEQMYSGYYNKNEMKKREEKDKIIILNNQFI